MAEEKKQTAALALRETAAIDFANVVIKDAKGLAQHMHELQSKAFILSPAVGQVAPGYTVTPVVVVIDPSVDADSGRGADVYYSPQMHKKHKSGDKWIPDEVSLNKYGLLKILNASGVDVQPTQWLHEQMRERYVWVAVVEGLITDFDGRIRRLPSGTASLDARDGSADIGEWTPEQWRASVAKAEAQKERTPEKERWKCKPEPINGWTAERVMQVRKFGAMLTETKALNRLARNLGVRQSYTIAELKEKPFIVYRPMFQYDMSDPEVRRMLTAANLGARNLLYPGAGMTPQQIAAEPVSHGYGEPPIEGEAVDALAEKSDPVDTASPPDDAIEATFEEANTVEKTAKKSEDVYVVRGLKQRGKGAEAEYFVETEEGKTFYTRDVSVAKLCAGLVGRKIEVASERVAVGGQTYLQILEAKAAELKL